MRATSIDPPSVIITVGIITTVITLPAISRPLNPDTASRYTLPTTIIISQGTTQTFSIDQITSLSDLRQQTTSTTTVTHSSSGSTRTDTITIPINTGGFY
jgi:glutamate/tyrosine decarboxylase-like PLP-dependent enzyme